MSGILKIDVSESVETLKQKLSETKTSKQQQRLQVLYWLKTHQAESVGQLAALAGKHRVFHILVVKRLSYRWIGGDARY